MGKLRSSLAAKIVALILLCLLTIGAVFSALGTFIIWDGQDGWRDPVTRWLYDIFSPMANYMDVAILTVALALGALAMLIFLLCAAGHKRGVEGIVPNGQDRIPLDLYLAGAGLGFFLCVQFAVEASYYLQDTDRVNLFSLTGMVVFFLLAGLIALATLLTITTRLKLGKWWRNTLCWWVLAWCVKLLKKLWRAALDFVQMLPMTWRAVVFVAGVLVAQTFLTIITFESNGFYFLPTLLIDGALLAGTALVTMQLRQIRDTGRKLANGDLNAKIDTSKMRFDILDHAQDLNAIGQGMNLAVEQRMRSERLKTELITNVSHDIKTPLTSIVSYVDLLQKEELPPQAAEYLGVLDRQSKRLKKLTEDLVEASKASTGNVAVHLEPIVVNEIIHQAVGDYDEKLSAGRLEVIVSTYEGNLIAQADGRLLWRVLDNLLGNVCKYALAGTRVYVDLGEDQEHITISVKNISRDPLNLSAQELTERFVRGDTSRHTEGSGLGLNIAMSLMELMGGTCAISTDGDLFKADLTLLKA